MATCNGPITGRRRTFWVTQKDACGVAQNCDVPCGVPGLRLYRPEGAGEDEASIATDDYITGLAINILGTDGIKDDVFCGHRPGARGGHWSDSFRDDGETSGTQSRYIEPQGSISENVSLIKAQIERSLRKLIKYEVATSVTVEANYVGGNAVKLSVVITGTNGKNSRVGIIGNRLKNSWAWEQQNG